MSPGCGWPPELSIVGDLVDVVADLGDLTAQGGEFVDVVVERGALAGQGEVAVDVGHDDGADVVGSGDVQRPGLGEDLGLLVDAVADVDALFALLVFAPAAAGDAVERGFVGGTRHRHGGGDVDGLVLLGRPLVPECLRHPRGGGFPVGPAGGRSNGIPCSACGWGRGHLLLVGGQFVVLVRAWGLLRAVAV